MSDNYVFTEKIQENILALLIRDKDTYEIYKECVKPRYFEKEVHNDIYRIATDYYKKYNKPLDLTILTNEVQELINGSKIKEKLADDYIKSIASIYKYDMSSADYLKDKITEFGRKQALSEAILESADILQKGGKYEKIEKLIKDALLVGQVNDLGVNYFENVEERINGYAEAKDVIERITTGQPVLDGILNGGLGRSEMGIIIAPPGRGKTSLLQNFGAAAVEAGYNVVHIFFENNKEQIVRNYDLRFVKKNFNYVKENVSRVIAALLNRKKYSKGKLFIQKYPVKSATANTIKSYIKQLQNVEGITPDLIIVDYGSLLRSIAGYKEKRDEFEAIYIDIRSIADEFNCALWTGAQCNRTSLSKKVITMADLAECFAIANAADVMVALCQSVKEQKLQIMRYFLAKCRDQKDHITLQGKDYRDSKVMTVDKLVTDEDENYGDDEDTIVETGSGNL